MKLVSISSFIKKNKKLLLIFMASLIMVVAVAAIIMLSLQVRNRNAQIAKSSGELEVIWSDYLALKENAHSTDEDNRKRIEGLEEDLEHAMLEYNQLLAPLKSENPEEYTNVFFKGAPGEKWDCLAAQTPKYSDPSKCPE